MQDATALTWLAVAEQQLAPEMIWQGLQSQIADNSTLSPGHAVLPGTGPLSDSITLSSFSVADGTHNFSVIQRPVGTTGGTVILTGGQP